jgi:hypothetical protein
MALVCGVSFLYYRGDRRYLYPGQGVHEERRGVHDRDLIDDAVQIQPCFPGAGGPIPSSVSRATAHSQRVVSEARRWRQPYTNETTTRRWSEDSPPGAAPSAALNRLSVTRTRSTAAGMNAESSCAKGPILRACQMARMIVPWGQSYTLTRGLGAK